MTTYLSLNGISDYLQCPSMTFDEIVMDFLIQKTSAGDWDYYFDARTGAPTGYFAWNDNYAYDTWGSSITGIKVNGSSAINNRNSVPDNQRCTIDASLQQANDDIAFFTRYTADSTNFTKGNLYDIKIYNAGVLIAHYDMSTGTVKDQSGNGNDATLVGGTWQSDTPTTTTIDSGPIAMSATGTLSTQSTRIQKSNVNMSAIGNLSAQAIRIINASTTMQGIGAMVVEVGNMTIIDSGPISMSATGSLAAKATRLVNERVSMSSASDMTTKVNRMILAQSNMQAESTLSTQGLRIVAVSADLVAQGTMDVVMGAELIGTIELSGQRELYVYLVGQRELNVNLKGVI